MSGDRSEHPLLGRLSGIFFAQTAPLVVTLFFGAIAWTTTRTIDRLQAVPLIEYSTTTTKLDHGTEVRIRLRNPAYTREFDCVKILLTPVDSKTRLKGDRIALRSLVVPTKMSSVTKSNQTVFELAPFGARADADLIVQTQGDGPVNISNPDCEKPDDPAAREGGATKEPVTKKPILLERSLRTRLFEHDVETLWGFIGLWGLVMVAFALRKREPPAAPPAPPALPTPCRTEINMTVNRTSAWHIFGSLVAIAVVLAVASRAVAADAQRVSVAAVVLELVDAAGKTEGLAGKVYRYDAVTGRQKWVADVDETGKPDPGIECTPGDRFDAFPERSLLSKKTGTVLCKPTLKFAFQQVARIGGGSRASVYSVEAAEFAAAGEWANAASKYNDSAAVLRATNPKAASAASEAAVISAAKALGDEKLEKFVVRDATQENRIVFSVEGVNQMKLIQREQGIKQSGNLDGLTARALMNK